MVQMHVKECSFYICILLYLYLQECFSAVEPQECLDALHKLSNTLKSPASSSMVTECGGTLKAVHYQISPRRNIEASQHR